MLQALIQKLEDTDSSRAKDLLKTIRKSVDEKHLLLYFNDDQLMSYINKTGANGAIRQIDSDYLMVVDANVSFSEVGMFIKEGIRYDAALSDSGSPVRQAVTVSYRNDFSETLGIPGYTPIGGVIRNPETGNMVESRGVFGDYVRVYAPAGSVLTAATGFDSEVKTYSEAGKTFCRYVLVRPGEEREIKIEYAPASPERGVQSSHAKATRH